jgi:hypothetical protein
MRGEEARLTSTVLSSTSLQQIMEVDNMEKFRVTNGDIQMLVYEKSFRLRGHHQQVYLGRALPREDAVKYAAMYMDIKRSGGNESPDQMFRRANTVWKVYDEHLVEENEQLKDEVEDLREEILRLNATVDWYTYEAISEEDQRDV